MSLTELLPAIRALPRTEKLRLIQVLAATIADEDAEAVGVPAADVAHTIWTPYDAHDAAAILLRVLHEDQATVA